jgi:hypothetical protein
MSLQKYLKVDPVFSSQIHSPGWGDKVDSGMGLPYRPARLHRLAFRYDNPMPESTLSHVAWQAGTTTRCRSQLYPDSQGL